MDTPYHTPVPDKPFLSEILRTARENSHARIPVFPVDAEKKPLTAHGFKDATTDPRTHQMWWGEHRRANIAIPTGRASRCWVLDVDREKGGFETLRALEAKHGELPATHTTKTGGGGLQLRFALPDDGTEIRNSAGKLGPGLDTRGEGGYVVVAPSVSTKGGYVTLDERDPAHAPPWLLERVVRPKERAQRPRQSRRPDFAAGDTIPEGARNRTLFFMALDLKDAGEDRDQALADLLEINARRCSPPLEHDEVEAIVTSAYRYPVRGGKTPPEVKAALEGIKRRWWATAWRGVGGKTERDIVRVLIEFGERYGHIIPAGVRFTLSWRALALAAGVSHKTVARVVKRLRLSGWLRGDNADREGTEAGAFVLLARTPDTTPHVVAPPSTEQKHVASGVTSARTTAMPILTPCFRWRGFVGKGKAGALYILEVLGEKSVEEITELLGLSRPRDVRRRYLDPLEELGLVENKGGVYRLIERSRYVERVQEIREAPCGGGIRKVRAKDAEGNWVSRTRWFAPKSEQEREVADRREYEHQRRRFAEHLDERGVHYVSELERVA